MFVNFRDISKEGFEKDFNFHKFMENTIYPDVCDVLKKESYLLEEIYKLCFYDKEYGSIQEYLEQVVNWRSKGIEFSMQDLLEQEGNFIGSVEDFIQESTQKIESAIQVCLNKAKEELCKYEFKFKFHTKHCDKATINCIIEFLSFLKQQGIEPDVNIDQDSYEFDREEILNLMDFREFLQKDFEVEEKYKAQFGKELRYDENGKEKLNSGFSVSFDKTIEAHKKMEEEIEKIEGLNLSPFEKFLYAHDFVANKIYKESTDDLSESRTFADAMTGDYIVCVGYAKILEKFCTRLGIDCKEICGCAPGEKHGHAANIVRIVDEKYGIDGEYFCDACYDSRKSKYYHDKHYTYAALPIQDIQHIEQSKHFNQVLEQYQGEKESKPISVKAFQKALTSVYSQIVGENFYEAHIKSALNEATRQSGIYISEGDNAFTARYKYEINLSESIGNNERLDIKQLKYIFKNLNQSDKLSQTVLELLNKLDADKQEKLIDILNKYFEYECLNNAFSYTCKNILIIPTINYFARKMNMQKEKNIQKEEIEEHVQELN